MFRKIETIEEAIAEGKSARVPGGLLIFATVAESGYRLLDKTLTMFIALDSAILLLVLAFLLWRVWDGKAVASAVGLLIVALACIWIGMSTPAFLLAFLGLWSLWDGVRGVRGGLAYRRLARLPAS